MPRKDGEKAYGVVWPAVNQVEIEEFDMPVPGEGELLLETEYTLISPGTERNWLTGRNALLRGGFPFRPGYTVAGRVKALGPGVSNFKVGDPVVVPARHASHVTVKASSVSLVPEGVDMESATLFSLGEVAIEGLRRARVELGEPVAVLGLGLIGLLCLQIARLCGAMPVIGLDIIDSRLQRGKSYGADIVVNSNDKEELEKVMAGLDGGGPAVVIEITAAQEPVNQALQMVSRLGRVVVLSSMQGNYSADLHTLHVKGIYLIGALTAARPQYERRPGIWPINDDIRVYLKLLQTKRLEVKSLITHRWEAKDAPKAYELIKAADPTLFGALLHWR
jgi:2-desacetyl-2-hydroxyethyl bacteriochlorophyllide A dehydrogenase